MKSSNLYPARRIILTASVCAGFGLLIPLILTQIVSGDTSRGAINDIASLSINLVVTIALLLAAKKSMRISRRLSWGWGFLGLAQLCLLLGDLFWAFLEIVLKSSPFPSIADGAYLFFYPFFLIGILLLPARRFSRTETLKKTLDIGIVLVAALLGFWYFLIGPMIAAGAGSPLLEQILTMAYPVGDIVMLYGLLIILYRRVNTDNMASLWLLAAGALITIGADVIFSYQNLAGSFQSGGILDSGWMLGYLLTGLAGVVQVVSAETYQPEAPSKIKTNPISEQIIGWLAYLSYVWVLAAYFLLVQSHYAQDPVNFLAIATGVAIIIGLVILRQMIAHNEIKELLVNLTKALDQVHHQASELDTVNQNLQHEISDRIRIQQQLSYDALHDELTGLPNRALLMDRLDHAVEYIRRESGNSYSVLLLDVDAFKVINDSLGHSAGDYMLVEISKRLKKCVRSIDTVARFGGDEFVVLLENVADENIAVQVADRIHSELSRPFEYKSQEVHATCSIGILKTINDFASSEEILRDVDIAMYWAKSSGKACYEIFTPDLRNAAITRMQIENELRNAILKKEFFFHYQPIYAIETRLIIGFEALLRWQNPFRGVVMPSEFIQIAEETGLIVPIGDWGLVEACMQLRKWQARYPTLDELSINVNISVKQLTQADFVDKVKKALVASGINPRHLNLEITENVMVANQKLIIDLFGELRKLGVKLQIDDFGTGYSSLSYLQHFPVDTLKIDRSFVKEMNQSRKSHELVKTIIQMAHELGMDTIAEGVETEDQLQELKKLTCTFLQGFLLSKPLIREAIESLLDQQAERTRPLLYVTAEKGKASSSTR
jgi:diguanylate cyclase (GGDEF)-like protein